VLLRRLAAIALATAPAFAQVNVEPVATLPPFPDPLGRAGLAAAAVRRADGTAIVIAAGGANFPGAPPWEGGAKVFHDAVHVLEPAPDGWRWRLAGRLPEPVAYAAFGPHPDGLLVAGGANASGHLRGVRVVRPDATVRELAPLPRPLAYAACATGQGRLWIAGGQEAPGSTQAVPELLALEVAREGAAWERFPWPAADRVLATASVLDGRLFLLGGCRLGPDDRGAPLRTYLRDTLSVRLDELRAGEPVRAAPSLELPWPLAAAAGPAIAREGVLLLAGADDGGHQGQPPRLHPGQRAEVLQFDPRRREVAAVASLGQGVVTAPFVLLGDLAVVVSGETRPGVRTPAVQALRLGYAKRYGWLDLAMLLLSLAALGAIALQARRRGSLGAPSGAPGRAAWLTVGLLFVVAALNYLDRQLLPTMAAPILRDVPQTNAQFGLLTAVFLFVYSALSPLGGILADRYSRRLVILVSLVVWSAVTWLTGHVADYTQLLAARALMGISEAFYIPAALALITDYHRDRTRSLATGLHMSGIYLGQAIAGLGGYAADALGWRMAFGVFGVVGAAYAVVLVALLREPERPAAATGAGAPAAPARPAPAAILAGLFGARAFWLLLAVMGGASVCNWFVLSWLPLLLREHFALSLGEAGALATLPSSVAKYVAVVLGGIAADRWAARDGRGRARLAALGFGLAGPAIALTTALPAGALAWFVALTAFQGVAQGLLDATLMPILRAQVDERFAASGYGFLNLVGAGCGGLSVLYGGALKDAGIPLVATLGLSGAGLVACGVALLCLPATVHRR